MTDEADRLRKRVRVLERAIRRTLQHWYLQGCEDQLYGEDAFVLGPVAELVDKFSKEERESAWEAASSQVLIGIKGLAGDHNVRLGYLVRYAKD